MMRQPPPPPPSITLDVQKVCSDNKKAVEFALGAVELMSSEIEEVDKNCLEEIDQLFKEVFENLKFANQRVEMNKELQKTLDENEVPSLEELPERIRNNYTQILGKLRRVEYTLSNKDLKKTVIDAKRKINASWDSLVELEAVISTYYESIRERFKAQLKKIQARKAKNGNKDGKNKNKVDMEDRVLLASQNPIRTVALIDQHKKEKQVKMNFESLFRKRAEDRVSRKPQALKAIVDGLSNEKNENEDGENENEVDMEDRELLASQNPIRTVALIDQSKKEKEEKMNIKRSRKRGANAINVSSDDLASKRFSSTETNNLLGSTEKEKVAEQETEFKSDDDEMKTDEMETDRRRHRDHTPTKKEREVPLKTIALTSPEIKRARLFQNTVKEIENKETTDSDASLLPYSPPEDLPNPTVIFRYTWSKEFNGKPRTNLNKTDLQERTEGEMAFFRYEIVHGESGEDFLYCCGDDRVVPHTPPSLECDGSHSCGILKYAEYKINSEKQYCMGCFKNRKGGSGTGFVSQWNLSEKTEDTLKCSQCGVREYHRGCTWRFEEREDSTFICGICQPNQQVTTTIQGVINSEFRTIMNENLNKTLIDIYKSLKRPEDAEKHKITTVVLSSKGKVEAEMLIGSQEQPAELMKKFDGVVGTSVGYTKHAIYVFQRQHGIDVLVFMMHTQEYICKEKDGTKVGWLVLDYLEAIHYVYPFDKKGAIFGTAIRTYWEYMKTRGYSNCFFSARGPRKGEDFCFNIRPEFSHKMKQEELEKWYDNIMEMAKKLSIVREHKTFKEEREAGNFQKLVDFPLFDGSLWATKVNWSESDVLHGRRKNFGTAFESYCKFHSKDNFIVRMTIEPGTPLEKLTTLEDCPSHLVNRKELLTWFRKKNLEFLSYRKTVGASVALVRELNSYFSSLKKSEGKSKKPE